MMAILVDGGAFFECPRWHEGRWWVSDFFRHTVYSFDSSGSDVREEAIVERQPSGLGFAPDGSLLVVSMLDRRLVRRTRTGSLEVVADLARFTAGACNDMVVDAHGRAWIGHFGYDFFAHAKFRPASLIRVDPDGTASVAADDLRFPNGSVLTTDGSTLIVGETFGPRYTAFTIAEDGSLFDRRVWAELPRGMYPDGCCLDAEDRIWFADGGGRGCLLLEAGGRVVSEIPPPPGMVTWACMLGGPDGTTLLQCCAPDCDHDRRSAAREAILVATDVDVPHAGTP
jgi:sugar lactone lactonase YvrE